MQPKLRWTPLSANLARENEGIVEPEVSGAGKIKVMCLTIRGWCLVSCLIHLILSLVALVLFFAEDMGAFTLDRLKTPVSQTINLRRAVGTVGLSWPGSDLGGGVALKGSCSLLEAWNSTSDSHFLKPLVISYGTVDMRLMLFIVYIVPVFFLFFSGLSKTAYYRTLDNGDMHVYHFVEASFTGPIIILMLCARSGVSDLMILLGAACCTWSSMVFGQLAALLFDDTSIGALKYGRVGTFAYYAVAHFAYWISFVCAVAMFSTGISVYSTCVSKQPDDVYAIMGTVTAYLMIMLFTMFGLVQTYVLFQKPRKSDYDDALADGESESDPYPMEISRLRVSVSSYAEFAYIFLGLFTKILLGLLLYIGSLSY